MRAVWNGVVLADSDDTTIVEGNHYFPADSVSWEYFSESPTHTICPWKGRASYYTVTVDGKVNADAAWTYSKPSLLARRIKGKVAFWRGVRVEPSVREPTGRPS